jgi:hypothetical protein
MAVGQAQPVERLHHEGAALGVGGDHPLDRLLRPVSAASAANCEGVLALMLSVWRGSIIARVNSRGAAT